MNGKITLVCSAFLAAVMSLSADEAVKEKPAAPLVAAEFECWEEGMVLVSGGWTTKEDRSGFTWFFTVSEILEVGEGEKKMRGRFRKIGGLEIGEYQRLQRMDDAAFLIAFGKLHKERGDADHEYWNEVRDGAVYYRDNDEEDDGFHEADVAFPKDLQPGISFQAYGMEVKVVDYEKEMAGPRGADEAVRMDFLSGGEVIDGERQLFYRVENWYGRGLSNLSGRVVELENGDDKEGRVMEESRLQRVYRPAVKKEK